MRWNNRASDYRQALVGTVPESGQLLLHHCLDKGHNYILTFWNVKGEVLNRRIFRLHSLG